MKFNFIILTFILLPACLIAQVLEGSVKSEDGEMLIGASIYWLKSHVNSSSDQDGLFKIPYEELRDSFLIASYVGFLSDTVNIHLEDKVDIVLRESLALETVEVRGARDGIVISNLTSIKTEALNETELKKAACCDLAGCFGTQLTVQAHTTNVITNSKELRILGLSGVYNQLLVNGLPMFQGLSYTYGLSSYPGTVVSNIFISKGANSVLQGYEGIAGQINVLTKDGASKERLLLNAYINSFGEKHLNVNQAMKFGYWSNQVSLHLVQPSSKIDRDKDQFLDLPLLSRYMVSNTLKYRDDNEWGWNAKVGLRVLSEKRIGGQLAFDEVKHRGGEEYYGQAVRMKEADIWTKVGYNYDDYHRIAFSSSAFHHLQSSYFGTTLYEAKQWQGSAKLQYELEYKAHSLKTGVSLRVLDLIEDIHFTSNTLGKTFDGDYHRWEVVPGLFVENTLRFLDDRLTWIAGARVDRHNTFGSFITPRTMLKYDFSAQTVVRANIGTGWRTVNLFSENINLLVSARDILIEEALEPESGFNAGINLVHKFDLSGISGYFSTDFYRTEFANQIFPDFDAEPQKVVIKNFYGSSIGNGFQGEMNLKFLERLDLKLGYNYLDVFRVVSDVKQDLPFNSKHRFLSTISYKPLSSKYHIDLNAHWFGRQRLPNTSQNPLEYRRPDSSEPYAIVNTQFTYRLGNWEIYTGVENIFDFRQERAIISWQDPFSPFFDANSVWGPTRAREVHLGFRYTIQEESN